MNPWIVIIFTIAIVVGAIMAMEYIKKHPKKSKDGKAKEPTMTLFGEQITYGDYYKFCMICQSDLILSKTGRLDLFRYIFIDKLTGEYGKKSIDMIVETINELPLIHVQVSEYDGTILVVDPDITDKKINDGLGIIGTDEIISLKDDIISRNPKLFFSSMTAAG